MGGIILANMVARTGTECALDVAVSISGGLDMRHELQAYRAMRLWQPLLTGDLRQTFVVGKWVRACVCALLVFVCVHMAVCLFEKNHCATRGSEVGLTCSSLTCMNSRWLCFQHFHRVSACGHDCQSNI